MKIPARKGAKIIKSEYGAKKIKMESENWQGTNQNSHNVLSLLLLLGLLLLGSGRGGSLASGSGCGTGGGRGSGAGATAASGELLGAWWTTGEKIIKPRGNASKKMNGDACR